MCWPARRGIGRCLMAELRREARLPFMSRPMPEQERKRSLCPDKIWSVLLMLLFLLAAGSPVRGGVPPPIHAPPAGPTDSAANPQMPRSPATGSAAALPASGAVPDKEASLALEIILNGPPTGTVGAFIW